MESKERRVCFITETRFHLAEYRCFWKECQGESYGVRRNHTLWGDSHARGFSINRERSDLVGCSLLPQVNE